MAIYIGVDIHLVHVLDIGHCKYCKDIVQTHASVFVHRYV